MWLVDIDGTTALRRQGEGERHWSDWHRVGEDLPNPAVITVIRALAVTGQLVVWLTGRPEECRDLTTGWLHRNVCVTDWHRSQSVAVCDKPLFMAKDGDNRGDPVIKAEIYDTQIVPVYGPAEGVLDDRARVVRMWRREKGLTVLSPAEGLF